MKFHTLGLIIALLFLHPDKWDLLKFLRKVKGKIACKLQTFTRPWTKSWPKILLLLLSADHQQCPNAAHNKKTQKENWLYVLHSSSTLLKFLLWKPPATIIVHKISILWFVWLCVCNTIQQIPFCSLVSSYLSMHFFPCKIRLLHP